LLGLAVFALPGCYKPPPRSEIESSRAQVNRLLAGMRTQQELSAFVGSQARVCVEATPSGRLCEWRLSSRDPGWAELATSLATEDRINLLCVLPVDGSDRTEDSCAAFPRRSNRVLYPIPTQLPRPGSTPGQENRVEAKARHERTANADLARAKTLLELATLMGAAPDSCVDPGDGTRSCAWAATSYTYGHGTLVRSLSLEAQKKVWMRCVLPADGGPRQAGSCHLESQGRTALR
jgi:hypothetical protein